MTVARFRASSCASLIAYAEVACTLLEAGLSPTALDASVLERELSGVHPTHRRRAGDRGQGGAGRHPRRMNTP